MTNRMNRNAEEEENSPLPEHVEKCAGELALSVSPVVICGVNRKINVGNFEALDVYAGVTIPLKDVDATDFEALREAVKEAAAAGFQIASQETYERYQLVKGE